MGKGISVFVGMDKSLKENLDYIKKAHKHGFDRIFTSLHIPEANYGYVVDDFNEITKLAKKLGMNIVADISPRAFNYLKADMNDIKSISDLKIDVIRVDFGFTPNEIALFTQNLYGIKIEINASTVTERFLEEFEMNNPNYKMFQASHNYYPRLNTGISEALLIKKNKLLRKYGVEISAFIPSQVGKRGPIYEGLPTLEEHRFMKPSICAKQLLALGTDNVFFGDYMANEDELKSVGELDENILELNIELMTNNYLEQKIIFSEFHINRADYSSDVIRSTYSREKSVKKDKIFPQNNIDRKIGYITIDNVDYLRYCGELQVCIKNLPADRRVNVVGKVVQEEVFLLKYIKEEKKFRFIEKKF
ncbi:MupG family TIM beta-alpha barrel fold protein [Clostridium sediminicola]|uniref:DUF871 domain-containing protein n=1 Tax=Clostridium sediminicola TaxID=3114879 RepID=UPI0031F1E0D3